MLLSNVYLLQPKTLGSVKKTEASLRSFKLQPLSLSLSPSVSFPNFSQKSENLVVSVSHVRSRNSTKFVLDLFATSSISELVLDLNEFDASKEDLESGVHQITM